VWDELEREKDSSALALLEKQRREAENKRLSPPLACRPGTSEEDTRVQEKKAQAAPIQEKKAQAAEAAEKAEGAAEGEAGGG
jgi:hypothetical protein